MSIKADSWIRLMSQTTGMIEPFIERQVRQLIEMIHRGLTPAKIG